MFFDLKLSSNFVYLAAKAHTSTLEQTTPKTQKSLRRLCRRYTSFNYSIMKFQLQPPAILLSLHIYSSASKCSLPVFNESSKTKNV